MNAPIQSWFARPALTKGAIHTIAIAYCTYDISDVLAEGVNLRNTFLHLTLFSLMKLFLMSFSYIGNVVSAQLIHKETPPERSRTIPLILLPLSMLILQTPLMAENTLTPKSHIKICSN